MVNYENGKIYKLYSPSKNIVYIGSTCEKYLSRRLQHHLADYKRYKNNKKNYTTSYDVLECEDFKIELLENVSCNNVYQLRERERFYIENDECVNKNIPNRTKNEYRQDNKDKIAEYNRNRSQKRYEAYKKKLCIEQYRERDKERKKEWKQNNKEHLTKYNKEYYKNNKEHLTEYGSQKVICECGCEMIRSSLYRHKKSSKHIKNLNKE